jgi:GMP synthase (glutamine-hydrolysing)
MHELHEQKVLILDFGSQYTQLIARRIREAKVYCEIYPYNMPLSEIRDFNPKGIILSGGPSSVYDKNAPIPNKDIFSLNVPILGICYGLQVITHLFGGKVKRSIEREYGNAFIKILDNKDLFYGFDNWSRLKVWMSHGDRVERIPVEFIKIAESQNSPIAALANRKRKIYGVQFHPEVVHTPKGIEILKNFLYLICKCRPSWTMSSFIKNTIDDVRARVKDEKVICALSGGVDSSVTATLMHKAIGEKLICIFIDNGLLRKNEAEDVISIFKKRFGLNLHHVDASERFLNALKGVTDPEEKRKIIGEEFIRVFEEKAKEFGDIRYLAQGTLYPDVIESISFKGPSATIKSHHNVGGLPEKIDLKLIEPLRELFKDEVRKVGFELGLPREILLRHPFPGPGLAVRILGEITKERLELVREADSIVVEEIKKAGLYEKVWQAFAVLLPVKSVGVMGDERTYEHVVAIRIVDSQDAMTADWSKIPYRVLERISNRIINTVKGINRVVYDISSKPPSTIEWE